MLAYVSGYSEPMGHIKGDELIDGIHTFRLGPDGVLAAVSRCCLSSRSELAPIIQSECQQRARGLSPVFRWTSGRAP